MNILVISGSPRRQGDSAALANRLLAFLDGKTDVAYAYDPSISPCVDCRSCLVRPGCALRDGMTEVYRLIEEADAVVLASPLYFSELSGPLLSLASRFQCYYAARVLRRDPDYFMKPKCGYLLLSGGGDTKDVGRAEATARILFRQINAEYLGATASLHTNDLPAKRDRVALGEAARAAGLIWDWARKNERI